MYKVTQQKRDMSYEVIEDNVKTIEEAEYIVAEQLIIFPKDSFYIERSKGNDNFRESQGPII